MSPRLLLDTHVLVRWLVDARRLSREQSKVLERAVKRTEPIAFSAMTPLEIAILVSEKKLILKRSLQKFFDDLRGNPVFRVLPLTYEVASEIDSVSSLRDPADRAIVATARVHRLQLVTSDERIIAAKLVHVIE